MDYERLEKRRDRFDAVVNEYLRANHYTTVDLSYQLGIDPSTLWRYRKRSEYFEKAPFGIIVKALKLAKCSVDNLCYICGL